MKKVVYTDAAPAPIGPYSQATVFGNQVFTSGQIAIDPDTGSLILENIEAETTMVLENLKAVLAAAGCVLEDVVKCSIFISDMNQFQRINAIYAQYFGEATAPARETVQVAVLPKNVNIEISAIAFKRG
jgi:2-iminobutanoate/2-iminopropanoate deaminase